MGPHTSICVRLINDCWGGGLILGEGGAYSKGSAYSIEYGVVFTTFFIILRGFDYAWLEKKSLKM